MQTQVLTILWEPRLPFLYLRSGYGVIIFLIQNLVSTSEKFHLHPPEDLIFVSENFIFTSGDLIFSSENSYSCINIHLCFNRTRYCDKVKFFKILKLKKVSRSKRASLRWLPILVSVSKTQQRRKNEENRNKKF